MRRPWYAFRFALPALEPCPTRRKQLETAPRFLLCGRHRDQRRAHAVSAYAAPHTPAAFTISPSRASRGMIIAVMFADHTVDACAVRAVRPQRERPHEWYIAPYCKKRWQRWRNRSDEDMRGSGHCAPARGRTGSLSGVRTPRGAYRPRVELEVDHDRFPCILCRSPMARSKLFIRPTSRRILPPLREISGNAKAFPACRARYEIGSRLELSQRQAKNGLCRPGVTPRASPSSLPGALTTTKPIGALPFPWRRTSPTATNAPGATSASEPFFSAVGADQIGEVRADGQTIPGSAHPQPHPAPPCVGFAAVGAQHASLPSVHDAG